MSRYRLYILLLSIVLLITISSIVWRHFTGQHKVKLSLLNQQDIQTKTGVLEQLLQEKRDEISLLEQSCAESEGDRIKQLQINSCLNGLLEEERRIVSDLKALLEQKEEEIKQLKGIKFKRLIEDTSIYQRLLYIKDENAKNSTGKMNLEEEDWEELLSEIDLVSFDFTTRLVDRYDALVDNDIRFCCLIKLGFKFSEIALILGCSVDAVYKKEKSILRRMDMEHTIRLKEILRNI